MIRTKGWNTWDVSTLGAAVLLPCGLEIRLGLLDKKTQEYLREFRWKNVARFGQHATNGSYISVNLRHKEMRFNLEYAVDDDNILLRASPRKRENNYLLVVEAFFNWGKTGYIEKKDEIIKIETEESSYFIRCANRTLTKTKSLLGHNSLICDFSESVYVTCFSGKVDRRNKDKLAHFLSQKKSFYEKTQVKGAGWLKECPEAITKVVAWNTIWEPINKKICSVLSREWACSPHFGGYMLCAWDTFFTALLSSLEDKKLAYYNVKAILDEIVKEGFVPNFASALGKSTERSQPPVGSYCVLKIYRAWKDEKILQEFFPKLLTWHKWWFTKRDGNSDGLLEFGAHPSPERGAVGHKHADFRTKAIWESGLDNSPMYDGIKFNGETYTLELADVGLNSLYALDSWALAEIARELGNENEERKLRKEYNRVKDKINVELWNEDKGIYLNRHWNGKFSYRISPTSFYPLIAGVAPKNRAERMVREHLLSKNEFWGKYVIPSISRDDVAFLDNTYFRGRIWGPLNFLVTEGLRRYEFDKVAHKLARKSVRLFRKEWNEESHIHENYNALTGEGDDDPLSSDPFYIWGALLPYLGIQELIDVEPWAGLRLGNIFGETASVENVQIGEDTYDVRIEKGIRVNKNGRRILTSDKPILIRNFEIHGNTVSFDARAEDRTEIILSGFKSKQTVRVKVNGQIENTKSNHLGNVTIFFQQTRV